MEKKEARKVAMRLIVEQLENTSYSLEREKFNNFNLQDVESITAEISKVVQQFKTRYNL